VQDLKHETRQHGIAVTKAIVLSLVDKTQTRYPFPLRGEKIFFAHPARENHEREEQSSV
jgi:hypothetical protein